MISKEKIKRSFVKSIYNQYDFERDNFYSKLSVLSYSGATIIALDPVALCKDGDKLTHLKLRYI